MWKRIASGIILAPLFLWGLFALPAAGIQIMLGIILIGSVYESSLIIGFKSRLSFWLYNILMLTAGYLSLTLLAQFPGNSVVATLMGVTSLWWLFQLYELRRFSVSRPGFYGSVTGRAGNASVVLLTTWIALNALYLEDTRAPMLFVYLVLTMWATDSGAYFFGKYFGSHKLAPNVSPGKTVEGVVGGVIVVAVFSAIFSFLAFDLPGMELAAWIVFTGFVAIISVVGDLNESALKRISGRKDSGTIIPGHGGLLDRIDSITAAAPFFYFGWQLFGWSLYR